MSPSESSVGPELEHTFARCDGRIVVTCFASNIHRVQQVVDAAAQLGRKVSLVGPLDAQEREHRAQPRPHRDPRRDARGGRARSRTSRTTSSWSSPPAARASRCRRCGGWPTATTRNVKLREGDTVVFSATPDPGQRARGERDDRPHLPPRRRRDHHPRRPDPRLGPRLRRGAEADAQPHPAALRDAGARRPPAPAPPRPAGRGGRRRSRTPIFRGENGLPLEIDRERRALRRARAGGHDLRGRRRRGGHRGRGAARPAHALGGRHLHRRRHDLRAGRPLGGAAGDHLPRRAVRRGATTAWSTRSAARSTTRSRARPRRRSARSTCSRTTCTTTSRSSSTTASSGGRWCSRVVVEV